MEGDKAMTNVPITPKMNIDFIIYNLIQAKSEGFTIPELLEEVKVYDNSITEPLLQRKIDDLIIKQNIVRQKFDKYYTERNSWKETK